jgi:hypothetical protein
MAGVWRHSRYHDGTQTRFGTLRPLELYVSDKLDKDHLDLSNIRDRAG